MTLKLLTLMILITAGDVLQAADSDSGMLRVMSFNIRNSAASDGLNAWKRRRDLVISTVREFNPDLLGVQEVLADQHDYLEKMLPDYSLVGVARDDGNRKGEWALVLYRTDRFQKRAGGNLWLSEHPEQAGSRSWDAACVRICTWVKLLDKQTGTELLFANTHFDHQGRSARVESARILASRLPQLAVGGPVILTGDFNCSEEDQAYGTLVHPGAFLDSYRQMLPEKSAHEATFHGFTGTTRGARIDWILHTREFKTVSSMILRPDNGPYPSDHYPIGTLLRLQEPTGEGLPSTGGIGLPGSAK